MNSKVLFRIDNWLGEPINKLQELRFYSWDPRLIVVDSYANGVWILPPHFG